MGTENFSNFGKTTLASAISAGATSLSVSSVANLPATTPFRIVIESEVFWVTGISGTTLTVVPGYEGTTQANHASGVKVVHGVTAGLLATLQSQSLQAPVSSTAPTLNQTLIWNGSMWVPSTPGATFTFGISIFSNSQGSSLEIGTSIWQSAGNLSFTASYSNGPATGGTVSMSGAGNSWASNLTMTNTFQGPTATAFNVDYPSSPDQSVTFTLSATSANGNASRTITHTFYNRVYYGTSTKSSGYVAGDITGLANNPLQGGRNASFTVNASTGQYILYAYPARYSSATFAVGGFTGGFTFIGVISVTNGSGYTENYNLYRSSNAGLGSTSVTVT